MKTKKRFCAKTNGLVNSSKKLRFSSAISVIMKPIRQWKVSESVKFLNAKSSVKCFYDEGSFHRAVYPILIIAQLFGILPVENISYKCPSRLEFTRKSFRYIFAVFVTISCGLEAISSITWTFKTRIEFGKLVILVYYITNFLSFFCFLRLAKIWPMLMSKWHEVENKLPLNESVKKNNELAVRIRRVAVVILSLSAVEHVLSIISSFITVWDCPRIKSILQAYYVHNFPQVFSFFNYSHIFGFYVKFIHVTSTFVWSFTDLFIMMISCGLSAKFKQINDLLFHDKGKVS